MDNSDSSLLTLATTANTLSEKETKELMLHYQESLLNLKSNVSNHIKSQQVFYDSAKMDNKMIRDDLIYINTKLNQIKSEIGKMSIVSDKQKTNINPKENVKQTTILPTSSSKNILCLQSELASFKHEENFKVESLNSKSLEKSKNKKTSLNVVSSHIGNINNNKIVCSSNENKTNQSNQLSQVKDIKKQQENENETYDINYSSLIDNFNILLSNIISNLNEQEELIKEKSTFENILQKHKLLSNQLLSLQSIYYLNSEKLNYSNNLLEEVNFELTSKIDEFEKNNNKEKFCLHCHNNFYLKGNEDLTCFYHPGKVKYYSCRGCGGDEYFTCCFKCSTCSRGCKKAKHVYEV